MLILQSMIERIFNTRAIVNSEHFYEYVTVHAADSNSIVGSLNHSGGEEMLRFQKLQGSSYKTFCEFCGKDYCAHVASMVMKYMRAGITVKGGVSVSSKPNKSKLGREVDDWLNAFESESPAEERKTLVQERNHRLFYVLQTNGYVASVYMGTTSPTGKPINLNSFNHQIESVLMNGNEDYMILDVLTEDYSMLRWFTKNRSNKYDQPTLSKSNAGEFFRLAIGTGRLLITESTIAQSVQIAQGENTKGRIDWEVNNEWRISPEVTVDVSSQRVFKFDDSIIYIDMQKGEVGDVTFEQPTSQIINLLKMPSIDVDLIKPISKKLAQLMPTLNLPKVKGYKTIKVKAQPVIEFKTLVTPEEYKYFNHGETEKDVVEVTFECQDKALEKKGQIVARQDDGTFVRTILDYENKEMQRASLFELGFTVNEHLPYPLSTNPLYTRASLYNLINEEEWPTYLIENEQALKAAGWDVRVHEDYRHVYKKVEGWDSEITENGGDWFNLNMGILVEGERIELAPLLHELFAKDRRWHSTQSLDNIDDEEGLVLRTEKGRVMVPAKRIKPLAKILIELFDRKSTSIRLSRYDLGRLDELSQLDNWNFNGGSRLLDIARKLKDNTGIQPAALPNNFPIELRPYQKEGVSWLQFLREHKLGGILGDDMGLGKTAQILAHILLEKQSGRMTEPVLIILPTSLIFNWQREIQKFTPELKTLAMHGSNRLGDRRTIPNHDIILTTYNLIWRDEEYLLEYNFHMLILDEAQNIKNHKNKASQSVRKIRANHRLCMTGTPLENSVTDVWAQFDFILPGLLEDNKTFTSKWRNPIEKYDDHGRMNLLAKRVKPFILRRKKEDVVLELPPKTVIVQSVELSGGQRDLYEVVRCAMNEKVRKEVEEKGLARSHIIILDAILKLRQVCCDPRLVKIENARKIQERAKLNAMMEMIEEMLSEGRRIIIFSQFTEMLELIEQELVRIDAGYVKLTGSVDGSKRGSIVKQFEEGEVPIFLASLKAGGVGLNLTSADTVILYDPWWNPAVENQAIDRAHRMGQKNPVFVYKMVVAGSIEEKIVAMQARKAGLADALLTTDQDALSKFSESDLAALFAPLESN